MFRFLKPLGLAVSLFLAACAAFPPAALAQSVPTIATVALLSTTNHINNPVLYLSGYYAAGDGGQGLIYRQAGSCSANGGTLFNDSVGTCFVRDTQGQPINAQWFGANISQSAATNCTRFTAWTTYLGTGYYNGPIVGPREGYLPAGRYNTNCTLAITNSTVVSGVPNQSTIVPASNVTKAVTQATASILRGISIDGVNTSGKVGLSIARGGYTADTYEWDGKTENVVVANFTGTGARAFDLGNLQVWTFVDCQAWDSYDGWYMKADAGGYPYDITFTGKTLSRSNSHWGMYIFNGNNVTFAMLDIEISGLEGLYLDGNSSPAIGQYGVIVRSSHFEANWNSLAGNASRNNQYQTVISSTATGFYRFEDTYWFGGDIPPTVGYSAKSLNIGGGTSVKLDNIWIPSAVHVPGDIRLNEITVSGTPDEVIINNWALSNGDFFSKVSDPNRITLPSPIQGTWTPSFFVNTGSQPTVAYDAVTSGTYTISGGMMTLSGHVVTTSVSGGSGPLSIQSFPREPTQSVASVYWGTAVSNVNNASSWATTNVPTTLQAGNGLGFISLYHNDPTSGNVVPVTVADLSLSGANDLYFTITYKIGPAQ